jgi:hypothetical protein
MARESHVLRLATSISAAVDLGAKITPVKVNFPNYPGAAGSNDSALSKVFASRRNGATTVIRSTPAGLQKARRLTVGK